MIYEVCNVQGKKLFYLISTSFQNCYDKRILTTVVDSGTQISIIRTGCKLEEFKNVHVSVMLQSALGHQLKAPLINACLSIVCRKLNY